MTITTTRSGAPATLRAALLSGAAAASLMSGGSAWAQTGGQRGTDEGERITVGREVDGGEVVDARGGDDTISLNASSVGRSSPGTVLGGDGADSIILTSYSRVGAYAGSTGHVLGDAGDDTISMDRSAVGYKGAGTVSGGGGADLIVLTNGSWVGRNSGSTGQILGDAGDDTIRLDGSIVGRVGAGTVSGGDGADSIVLTNNSRVGAYNGSTGQVLGDAGDDTISVDRSFIGLLGAGTVSGGAGDDLILLTNTTGVNGSSAIQGDAGNDTIALDGSVSLIDGALIDGGADKDTLAFLVAEGRTATGFASGTFQNFELATLDGGGTLSVTTEGFGKGFGTFEVLSGTASFTGAGGLGSEAVVTGGVLSSDGGAFGGADVEVLAGGTLRLTGDEAFGSLRNAGLIELFGGNFMSAVTNDGTITGTAGADSIRLVADSILGDQAGDEGRVLGDAGDDTISVDRSAIGRYGAGTVSGGDGADSIILTEYASLGAETGGTGQVLGDAGDDTISLSRTNVGRYGAGTVSGGDGADSIVLTTNSFVGVFPGSAGQVLGEAGNDTINLAASDVGRFGAGTVSGGEGADLIVLRDRTLVGNLGGTGQVLGDAGDDTITLENSYVGVYGDGTVAGGADGDRIELRSTDGFAALGGYVGATGTIRGDAGADTIILSSDYVVADRSLSIGFSGTGIVSGGEGADRIEISGGTSIARNSESTGNVSGDGGDDTISVDRSYVGHDGAGMVSGGDGADSIVLANGSVLGVNSGGTGEVRGDAGDDTISFDDAAIGGMGNASMQGGGTGTVSGGDGADLILLVNGTSVNGTSSVSGDAGDDTIRVDNSRVGNSYNSMAVISGGDGADLIALTNRSSIRGGDGTGVFGDAGDDVISLSDSSVGRYGGGQVSGGDGDDIITMEDGGLGRFYADGVVSLTGDAGNDTITLTGTRVGFDAETLISGGEGTDSITLTGVEVGGYVEGGYVEGMTQRIEGGADDDVIVVVDSGLGRAGSAVLDGGDGDDAISLTDGTSVGRAGYYADASGSVLGGAGSDTITVDGGSVGHADGTRSFGNGTIDGGDGDDAISLTYATVGYANAGGTASGAVRGGEGDDTILGNGVALAVAANESATASGMIDGGSGNDTILLTNGSIVGLDFAPDPNGNNTDDTVVVKTTAAASANIRAGTGDDFLSLIGLPTITESTPAAATASASILGGAGDDLVGFDDTTMFAASTTLVDGGEGVDMLAFTLTSGEETDRATVFDGTAFTLPSQPSFSSEPMQNRLQASDITGFERFELSGDGTLLVTGAFDLADALSVTGGTMSVSGEGSLAASEVVLSGGTLTTDGGAFSQAATLTLSGGTLDLGGDERVAGLTYEGGTLVAAEGAGLVTTDLTVLGTLAPGDALTGDGTGTLTVGEGGTLDVAGTLGGFASFMQTAGSTTVSDGGVLDVAALSLEGGTLALTGIGRTTAGTVSVSGGTLTTDGGAFAGDAALTVTGGRLALAGDEAFGSLTVEGGAAEVGSGATLTVGELGHDGGLTNLGTLVVTEALSGGLANQGKASVSGTLSGAVQNAGTFTISGGLSGDGAFDNRAGGALSVTGGDLTGLSAFSNAGEVRIGAGRTLGAGMLSLTGGAFDVQGTARGDVTATGGVVSGTGLFDGLLVLGEGATLSPGNSIGTLSVEGGLVIEEGSTTIIEVAQGSTDRVDVTGTVAIEGGTLVLNDLIGATPEDDTSSSYVLISNDGTDAVTGAGFTSVVDNLAFVDPILTLMGGDGNDVGVSFDVPATLDLAGAARSGNQAAAGAAFAGVLAGGEDGDAEAVERQAFFDAFLPLSNEQAQAALESLSGAVHASAQWEAGQTALFLGREALAAHRAGTSEDGSPRFFARLTYRNASVEDDPRGAAKHDAEAAGIVAGVDAEFADGLTLGAGFAYYGAETDLEGPLGVAEEHGFAVSGTALYERGQARVAASVGHAFGSVDTGREVRVGTLSERADAAYDVETTYGLGEASYRVDLGRVVAEPFAGAGIALARRDAFTERGGSLAALSSEANDETYGYAELGLRVTGGEADRKLRPYASASYEHLIGEVTPDSTLSFANGPAFSAAAANHDRDRLRAGAGLSAKIGQNGTAFLGYEGAFSGSDEVHSAQVGVRVRF
jgi:uncharacterized protein YhjY with autotransporter beta-barrel domain